MMTMYYQNDPIYKITSHIGPPWSNPDSNLILNIAFFYVITMAIIWITLYILAKRGKITLLQFTIFITYLLSTFLSPIIFELTYWYIAVPFNCIIIILFSLQNKYDLKLKEEEAKGITAIIPEEREEQKKEWDALTKEEKQNKLNQYNYKSHKLLQSVNIPLLLILVVFSIIVTFSFHIQSGNTYLLFSRELSSSYLLGPLGCKNIL